MTITRRAVLAGGLSLAALPLRAQVASAQAATPVREITPIAGPVYRFRNNFHYSIFVVTPEGVIATDPVNADAARWLKAEIARSFAQPIRFVVYSHDHADHISGGEVFADTARIVAHENARRTIIAEKRPTAVPQVTFSDRMAIDLGGTTVELLYVGRNHSDNSVVMRFPKERLLFAVDFIPVKAVGFRDWPDAYIEDWIESLRRVEAMDFGVQARAEALPFRRRAFDTVVSGLVFRSVDDPEAGLGEVRRTLRPGGTLRMLEHVQSERPWRARVQDLIQPAWTRVAGGCRPNRDTERTVEAAGFAIEPATRRARGNLRRFVARDRSASRGVAGGDRAG